MTNDYVTLPREPTREMLAAFFAAIKPSGVHTPGWLERGYAAMIAAAPPAASGRARELAWIEDRFGDEFATPAADQRYTVQALADGEWLALRNGERLNGEPEDVIYGTRAAGKAACQQHFNAYVRSLLAPTVDERAASSEPEMCPNCVTPWKCNGPHEFPQAASSEAAVAEQQVPMKLTIFEGKDRWGFAACCIGVMLKMLREKFSDREIAAMFQRRKVLGILNSLERRAP